MTSNKNTFAVKDAEIRYFTADWQDYSGASGFVFNMDGYAMGMLTHTMKPDPVFTPAKLWEVPY